MQTVSICASHALTSPRQGRWRVNATLRRNASREQIRDGLEALGVVHAPAIHGSPTCVGASMRQDQVAGGATPAGFWTGIEGGRYERGHDGLGIRGGTCHDMRRPALLAVCEKFCLGRIGPKVGTCRPASWLPADPAGGEARPARDSRGLRPTGRGRKHWPQRHAATRLRQRRGRAPRPASATPAPSQRAHPPPRQVASVAGALALMIARPSGAAMTVVAAFENDHRPALVGRRAGSGQLGTDDVEKARKFALVRRQHARSGDSAKQCLAVIPENRERIGIEDRGTTRLQDRQHPSTGGRAEAGAPDRSTFRCIGYPRASGQKAARSAIGVTITLVSAAA